MNTLSEDSRNQLGFLYLTFAVVLLTMLTSRTEAEVLERDCHINNFIPTVVCLEMEQPESGRFKRTNHHCGRYTYPRS